MSVSKGDEKKQPERAQENPGQQASRQNHVWKSEKAGQKSKTNPRSARIREIPPKIPKEQSAQMNTIISNSKNNPLWDRLYYINAEGTQEQIEENSLLALWQRRDIAPGTLCWKEGMADWMPASVLFKDVEETVSAQASPETTPEVQGYSYTKDPRTLTKLLIVMLFVSLLMELIAMVGDLGQFTLLSRDYTVEEGEANDTRQGFIAIAYLVVFIITGIVFLKWIYRANVNSRGFGATDMTHTPGWSVGWFFVPILCLVRPYQAMKEVWQVSKNPSDWSAQQGGTVLTAWWTLWIIASILGQISFRMSTDTIEQLKNSTMVSMVSEAEGIALCIVAIMLVKTIAGRQDALVNGTQLGMDRLAA